MLRILGDQPALRHAPACDGLTRREMLRVGGLGALGLSLPALWQGQAAAAEAGGASPAAASSGRGKVPGMGNAKSCIILFLMGAPPQHSTWDPKPDAPAEVRGEFKPISTAVSGVQICELFAKTARLTDRLALLRAVSSDDNAHSSSGYYMLTGTPHVPKNSENANPGFPNNSPNLGAIVRKLLPDRGSLPSSVRLPHRIFNTDGSVWPGQDAGFLGQSVDPWLLNCQPATPDTQVSELSLSVDLSQQRLSGRQVLLEQVNQRLDDVHRAGNAKNGNAKNGNAKNGNAKNDNVQNDNVQNYGRLTERAFDVLSSRASREAFRLDREKDSVRDRYGRTQFGQSVLLSRRLIEAGVSLVQVNWYRGPEEPSDAPCWDSHVGESERLKTVLAPPADQAMSALIEDLVERGRLDDTLVVCMAEFGRTPKFNGRAGRDHWGHVYSVALAGGGIKGGIVHGASDALGAYPASGRVEPQDLTATIFHCLGLDPHAEIRDTLGRPLPISRGEVLRPILA